MRKKQFLKLIILLLIITVVPVFADSVFDTFCLERGVKMSLKFLGYLIFSMKILIPILIILMGTIDLSKAIVASNDDQIKENSKILTKRLIIGIIIFFIPTILNVVFSLVDSYLSIENSYDVCRACLSSPGSCEIPPAPTSVKINITEEFIYSNGDEASTTPNPDSDTGETTHIGTSSKYPKMSITRGKYGSFPFNEAPEGRNITIDPKWVSSNIVVLNVPCNHLTFKAMKVHRVSQPYFLAALDNICKLTKNGINGIKLSVSDINFGGSFVARRTSKNTANSWSNHAWGIAVDFNYSWSTTINGKKYTPYASMGSGTYNEYWRFVNALGGNESDVRNVNYILWKYAFEPAGFKWGGNWSKGSFDPMHYEVDWQK